jgi:hypothetical protein
MLRSDIVNDRIRVAQDKARKGTTNELLIPIHPALARALQAGPVVGMTHIITDARGRPLRSLTDLIEAAVKRAGLPPRCVAHGLRKAALRRLAEHGSTTKEIAAVSGIGRSLKSSATRRGRTKLALPNRLLPSCPTTTRPTNFRPVSSSWGPKYLMRR